MLHRLSGPAAPGRGLPGPRRQAVLG